jgi:hypothetical protein
MAAPLLAEFASHAFLIYFFLLRQSHCVTQAGLELEDPPASQMLELQAIAPSC